MNQLTPAQAEALRHLRKTTAELHERAERLCCELAKLCDHGLDEPELNADCWVCRLFSKAAKLIEADKDFNWDYDAALTRSREPSSYPTPSDN